MSDNHKPSASPEEPAVYLDDRRTRLLLIRLFRERRCLWDLNHESYKSANLRYAAWLEIASSVNWSVAEVKCAINNMRSQFLRQHRLHANGDSVNPNSRKVWWLYREMLFLSDTIKSRTSNMELSESESEVHDDVDHSRTEDERAARDIASATSINRSNSNIKNSSPAAQGSAINAPKNVKTCDYQARVSSIKPSKGPGQQQHTIKRRLSPEEPVHMPTSSLKQRQLETSVRTGELDDECERFGKFIASELRKRPSWELDLLKRQILADIFGQLPQPGSSITAQRRHAGASMPRSRVSHVAEAMPAEYVEYYDDVGAEYTANE